jgi:hypothetical protein
MVKSHQVDHIGLNLFHLVYYLLTQLMNFVCFDQFLLNIFPKNDSVFQHRFDAVIEFLKLMIKDDYLRVIQVIDKIVRVIRG